MEKAALTGSWEASNLQSSPASLPPNCSPQIGGGGDDTQLHFTGDRQYFMHGEIIAFTAISVFVIFFLFLIFPWIRRTTGSAPTADSDSGNNNNSLPVLEPNDDQKNNTLMGRLD